MKILSIALTAGTALAGCATLTLSVSASAGTLQNHAPPTYTEFATPYTGFADIIGDNFRAKYRFEKGIAQFEAGNFDAATKQFKKAHRWASKHPLTNLMVGASLYKQGDFTAARSYLETSLATKRIVLAGKLKKTAELMLAEINAAG